MASQLGASRVGVRSDLTVTRHMFRGLPGYIVKDPLTLQTHRLTLEDYLIFIRIQADGSLAEVFDELLAERILERSDEEHFYVFILTLHRQNFLHLPIADEQRLYKRHEAMQGAKRKRAWMNLLFLRVSLFNPDRFLDRTAHRVKWLFTRPVFAVWIVTVVAGLAVAWHNASDLAQPLSQVLLLQNLPLLWVSLVVLKVLHEAGHAYACKLLRGEVPEIGIHFIALTPLPYVDATAAWSFPRKRDRLIVSVAGMYLELFVAAVAIMLWSVAGPGLLKAAAYNIAFLASVVTVAFNMNPLMKFDGYYLLSDVLEVPNLRQRSTNYAKAVLKRIFLGLPMPQVEGGRRAKLGLLTFGVSCVVYRFFLVLAISATVASRYFFLGLGLATVYVLSEATRVLIDTWKLLFRSEETANLRIRASMVGCLLLIFVPAGVCLIPLPSRVLAPALVGSLDQTTVRAEAPGFVSLLFAEPSQHVEQGAPLVFLEHSRDEAALLQAKGRLEQARLQTEAVRYQDWITARLEEERADHLAREVAWYEREKERRQVHAPIAGRLVYFFDALDSGRYIQAGEPVATISAGVPVIRVLLNEQQMAEADPQKGQEVLFRSVASPTQTFPGRVLTIQPAGSRLVEEVRLTHLGGGNIPVNPTTGMALEPFFELVVELTDMGAVGLPHGSSGRAQMKAAVEPLGRFALRKLLRFLQRLKRN